MKTIRIIITTVIIFFVLINNEDCQCPIDTDPHNYINLTGKISDNNTKEGIDHAQVRIGVSYLMPMSGGSDFDHYYVYTDTEGIYKKSFRGYSGYIYVTHDSYHTRGSTEIVFEEGDNRIDLELTPK